MTCQIIMTPNPAVLKAETTVAAAVKQLLKNRMLGMPVVDASGRYLGMFTKSRLFGLVLPSIIAIEEALPSAAHLEGLGFLSDNLDTMQARLDEIGSHPVGDYADSSVPALHPESPAVAAVVQLFRTRNFIPITDSKTGKLVGIVSTWETLAKLSEHFDDQGRHKA